MSYRCARPRLPDHERHLPGEAHTGYTVWLWSEADGRWTEAAYGESPEQARARYKSMNFPPTRRALLLRGRLYPRFGNGVQ